MLCLLLYTLICRSELCCLRFGQKGFGVEADGSCVPRCRLRATFTGRKGQLNNLKRCTIASLVTSLILVDGDRCQKGDGEMRNKADRIVNAPGFGYSIVVLIIASAIVQAIITAADVSEFHQIWMGLLLLLMMFMLVLEVLLKIIAEAPRIDRYFRDGWNVFDFLVISFLIASLFVFPAASPNALLFVLVRLLRLLEGFATIQAMRVILSTLFRTIPRMAHVVILLGVIIYMYAISGHNLFGESDEEHWGTLGVSVLSLFQVVTLDGWSDIMKPALEFSPYSWIYFVSFVIATVFVGANLFVAVVVSGMEQAERDDAPTPETPSPERPAPRDEVLRELRTTQESLRRLEESLQRGIE